MNNELDVLKRQIPTESVTTILNHCDSNVWHDLSTFIDKQIDLYDAQCMVLVRKDAIEEHAISLLEYEKSALGLLDSATLSSVLDLSLETIEAMQNAGLEKHIANEILDNKDLAWIMLEIKRQNSYYEVFAPFSCEQYESDNYYLFVR